MKRIVWMCLLLVSVAIAFGQTNFRDLIYEQALETAKAEKKFVFLDFYTTWCGPCKKMLAEVFPLKKVGDYLNGKFVCVKIDGDSEAGKRLAKEYKLVGYPTFVVLAPDGQVMKKISGGQFDAEQFIDTLDEGVDFDKTPTRLQERYDAGERTADLISAFANLKLNEAFRNFRPDEKKKQEAYKMVQDYFDGLTDAQRVSPENLFMYLSYTNSVKDPMVVYMVKNRERFSGEARQKAEEHIQYLYNLELMLCLMSMDAERLARIKPDVEQLGLNKNGVYTPCYQLIDGYREGDSEAFLRLCEKNYDSLNNEQKRYLMMDFAVLMSKADVQTKKGAIEFVRRQLYGMEVSLLNLVPRQLQVLEEAVKKGA